MGVKHAQAINKIYKPVRINFPRRRFEILSNDDCLLIDLADMSWIAKENKNHKYFLLANNLLSKKIFIEPLKTKSAREVTEAMKRILSDAQTNFKNIMSDKGTEFKNAIFKKEITEKFKINHYFRIRKKRLLLLNCHRNCQANYL